MKSLINYHFCSKVPRTGVGVAYFQSDPIFSSDSIALIDTSTTISNNSFSQQDTVIELNDNNLNYYIDKKGFLLTDRFNPNDKPLYYKHTLEKDIFTGDNPQSVAIIDSNGNQIDDSFFVYDCGNKAVYHSLVPEEDRAYFVIYPRANSNNQVIESRYKELLESHPALREADADSVDECGLDPDSDSYIVEELDGQPHFFRLRLPRPAKYNLRYTEDGLLKLHVPKKSQIEPWYVEVQDATVLTNHTSQDVFLRYNISEFNQQTFYPFPPIKLQTNAKVEEIDDGLLDLGFKNIILTNKTPVDILISDANGNITRAFTTDNNKSGEKIKSVFWETDGVISIDEVFGRVKIYRQIKAGERVTASFFYKTNKYTYTGWNFNPAFNSQALNSRVAILIKPYATDCFNSLLHIVINENKTIASSSDSDITDWIDGSKTFDDFISEWVYTPGSSTTNQNNLMLLGIVSTHTPISPDQSATFDSRRRGGGVQDHLLDQALNLVPAMHNNWDIGYYDGPPVPIHGAILIYLPQSLLSIYSEKQLRALASKYSAAGTYIVIRYYS